MKEPDCITITSQELESYIEEIENSSLKCKDTLIKLICAYTWIQHKLEKSQLSVGKLKKCFQMATEKWLRRKKKTPKKKRKKGHGRKAASSFSGAKMVRVPHSNYKCGDHCPDCQKGKLYQLPCGSFLHIVGQPWVSATNYTPERLRCALCGKTFTAVLPHAAHRVDSTAKATVSLLKYRGGVPFYRQSQIQHMLGIPISANELQQMTEDVADSARGIFKVLFQQAAQGDCIHNDDTNAKILDLMKKPKEKWDKRKGVFTTAILSKGNKRSIALYFTGRKHAGENIHDLLNQRGKNKKPPIQSCDGLSRNFSKTHVTHVAKCLSHARRHFYHLHDKWPKQIGKILDLIGEVYDNDRKAPEEARERLKWHQKQSKPLMKELKKYCSELIRKKEVEPNSGLGSAIRYLNNHWKGLTLFLEKAGVPIDNNEDERLIKRSVLNRKNGLFFKSEKGAKIGDILLSVIETCVLNKVNPWNYLVAIQRHQYKAKLYPENWLPWNYRVLPASTCDICQEDKEN